MIERLLRSLDDQAARARTARCADMAFCGTASAFAISPAASLRLALDQQAKHAQSRRLGEGRERKNGLLLFPYIQNYRNIDPPSTGRPRQEILRK